MVLGDLDSYMQKMRFDHQLIPYTNRHFSKEDTQRAQRHMKRCSASLAFREMQIKTTIRYHFTLVTMTIINKSTNNSVVEDVGKREPYYIVGGNADWCSHCGKQCGISSEN